VCCGNGSRKDVARAAKWAVVAAVQDNCREIAITLIAKLRDNERYRLWLLKNSFWLVIRVKSGDQKCLEIREGRL
jgi:hypothetical protein